MDLQKLLSEMTVDEKLAQMTQLVPQVITDKGEGAITGPMRNFGITKYVTSKIGSSLGGSGAKQLKDLQDFHLNEDPHKIPLLFMADVIHGYRTLYPVPLGLGASFDEELAKKCSAMAAKEASVGGIHVTFAPMSDLFVMLAGVVVWKLREKIRTLTQKWQQLWLKVSKGISVRIISLHV